MRERDRYAERGKHCTLRGLAPCSLSSLNCYHASLLTLDTKWRLPPPLNAQVNCVVALTVPDAILEDRICGRWIHKESGRSYHATFKGLQPKSLPPGAAPTKDNMKDDVTGQPLVQRPDDTKAALSKRMASYHGETTPVLSHYKSVVHVIQADQSTSAVWAEVEAALKKHGW